MPYTVFLTSHRRFEDVRAKAPDRMTLEDLRACLGYLARSRPVELVQRPDGATWVFRKGEAQASFAPLFSAGVRPNNGPRAGTIELWLSTTSPFFPANLYEALTLAALVNEELRLFAFESTRGLPLEVDGLNRLLDAKGEYMRELGRLWLQRREDLRLNIRMPFEVPAGGVDEATNMLAFRLKHPKLPKLEELLKEPPGGQAVEVADDQGVWVDVARGEPVTWFLRNPHARDELLIWPHWGEAPFMQTARETYAVGERLQGRAGGKLLWDGEPCTPKRMAWLQRYPTLLGVEFMQWLANGWEPTVRGG